MGGIGGRPARRQGGRRPDFARRLVAQVDHLAGRIGGRVVAPWRQAIQLAIVAGPCIAAAALGDEEAE